MSHDGTPTSFPTTPFRTVSAADDVTITQEDEGSIRLRLPGVQGYIEREAAKNIAVKLMDAAQQPYETEPDPSTHREKMGLSQEEAAKRMGIARTYLSQIECGTASNVSLRICRRMAALYDCTIEELGIEIPSRG